MKADELSANRLRQGKCFSVDLIFNFLKSMVQPLITGSGLTRSERSVHFAPIQNKDQPAVNIQTWRMLDFSMWITELRCEGTVICIVPKTSAKTLWENFQENHSVMSIRCSEQMRIITNGEVGIANRRVVCGISR